MVRGFRGSIQPYNPEKNEVSIKSFKYQALKANVEIDPKLFFLRFDLRIVVLESVLYTAAQALFCV